MKQNNYLDIQLTSMSSVLSLDNITKFYGRIRALKDVSFEVPEGSVFGILGPNGSGKTTLLSIILDVLKANKGNFLWFGHPGSREQRKKIGSLLETPNFYHLFASRLIVYGEYNNKFLLCAHSVMLNLLIMA